MAKLIMPSDLSKLIGDLRSFNKNLEPIIKKSVYPGAGYMANEIKKSLQSLPTQDGKNGKPPYVGEGKKLTSISSVQKQDLINSLGVAPFKESNGYIHVKIGFDGYGSYATETHPNGIPNQLLARSLEKGTFFLKRNRVITKTVNKYKANTQKKIEDNFIELTRKEFK